MWFLCAEKRDALLVREPPITHRDIRPGRGHRVPAGEALTKAPRQAREQAKPQPTVSPEAPCTPTVRP